MWLFVPSGSPETLNRMTYLQAFSWQSSAMELKIKATHANVVNMLDSKNVVELLMDPQSGMSILMVC